MAPMSRKVFREMLEKQMHTGRRLRNMSFTGMASAARLWQPAIDIYESDEMITIYCELAGVIKDSLQLLVEEHQLYISGRRVLAEPPAILCIHQLEIERGQFSRAVPLPALIDIKQVSSSYRDGILVISLQKRKAEKQVTVRIHIGG